MDYYDYYGAESKRSLWYYLVFPIDAWSSHEGDPEYDGFYELKQQEILPIMLFLMPLIVIMAGFFVHPGLFSGLFFYGMESILLALVCRFYTRLENIGFVIELFINFWISFIFMTLGILILSMIFGFFLFD